MMQTTLPNFVVIMIAVILIFFAVGISLSIYFLFLSHRLFQCLKIVNKKRWRNLQKLSYSPPTSLKPLKVTISYYFSKKDEKYIQIHSIKKKLRLIFVLISTIYGLIILKTVALYIISNNYFKY